MTFSQTFHRIGQSTADLAPLLFCLNYLFETQTNQSCPSIYPKPKIVTQQNGIFKNSENIFILIFQIEYTHKYTHMELYTHLIHYQHDNYSHTRPFLLILPFLSSHGICCHLFLLKALLQQQALGQFTDILSRHRLVCCAHSVCFCTPLTACITLTERTDCHYLQMHIDEDAPQTNCKSNKRS